MTIETWVQTVYQAAGDERRWQPALEQWRRLARAESAQLMLYQGLEPVGVHAQGPAEDTVRAFIEQGLWTTNERIRYFMRTPIRRFLPAEQYFPQDLLSRDVVAQMMARCGLRHQAGTIAHLDGDAIFVFAFERTADDGAFTAPELRRLDRLRTHLVAAARLARHLGQQQAAQCLEAMTALRLGAAVLRRDGSMLACNTAFDKTLPDWAELDLRHRVHAHDPALQRSLMQWLSQPVGSDPLRASPTARPDVQVELLPLFGPVRDRLFGGHALLVVRQAENVRPANPALLQQRYGLRPKEAELACHLASGLPLREAAGLCGLTYTSARTYLDRIYDKTGTHRQPELVRLVLGAGTAK